MVIEPINPTPVFRVTVVSRNVQAVNYQTSWRGFKAEFRWYGTCCPSQRRSQNRKQEGLHRNRSGIWKSQQPTTFGNEYLTYIFWAISPEGGAINLGEVLVGDNHRSKLDVTTDLQAFALVVTAEPYYAVRQPSNVVVIENVVREDTKGTTETVNAKYELLERGGYIPTGYKFDPVVMNSRLPLEFFEARNALRIAQSEGAETYASASYQHAVQLMNTADGYATSKNIQKKELIAASREAVQTAEDARAIAVKKIAEQRAANERQASAAAQAQTQARADDATQQKELAQSDAAKAQAETAQAKSATAAAQADAEQSRLAALRIGKDAETDKAAMRARLSEQLNSILRTRDSARGLIVNMSDVLFDTGKYSLKSGAREKLAKVAGILLAYPGLNIEVGGYTDNVGGDEMNQKLSENRADSVRDYLVQEGVSTNSVTARGLGNSLPVASNNDAAGRQQNRRVELVVSGEAIGVPVTATTGSLR